MSKSYVPEGTYTACNKGTSPSQLRVSNHESVSIYNQPMATEADLLPFFNIKPMGLCTSLLKIAATGPLCLPTVLKWEEPKDGVKINGNRMLLVEDSYCNCIYGGKIQLFFDRASAVAYGVGEGKMPSEYIKDGFDWAFANAQENRDARDAMLPEWMQSVAHVGDWFSDATVGLVEGAVTGIVGLGEVVYQVAQDPVGMGEAIGGMISDADKWLKEKEMQAIAWASEGENWSNAAEGAWDWASNGDNWTQLGEDAVQGVKDTGSWIAENPRKIGNTVGEFIPDAVAAVYTGGGSLAATAGKKAVKEVGEEVVEKVVRESLEEAGEQAAKETTEELAEAGAKKTAKELAEAAAKKKADDVGKVVTKSADDLTESKLDDIATKIPNWKGPTDYSDIDVSRFTIKEGGDFTPAHKKAIYEANMKHNDGLLRSDMDGTVLEMPQKSQKGVTPSPNEAQVDHINPKSKGGTNDPSTNAQVLSRQQNREKWDN